MGTLITLLPPILSILSELPSIIAKAEAAFGSASGSGPAKKDFVLSVVKEGLSVFQSISKTTLTPEHIASIVTTSGALTDATVATMNTIGIFKKPATPTA